MLIPAPDYFYKAERIMGIDDIERTLSIIQVPLNICSECHEKTFTSTCSKCSRDICDACSDWIFRNTGRGRNKIRVIDVKCPCRRLLYNDFY